MKRPYLPMLMLVLSRIALAGAPTTQPSEIVIECDKALQQIDGFGTSTFGGFELFERGHFDDVVPVGVTYHTTKKQREDMIKTAVGELGVSHARIWLWPGTEMRNDNDDPDVMDWNAFTFEGYSGRPQSTDQLENRMNGLKEWGEFLKLAVPLGLKNWIVTPGELSPWLKKRINDPKDARRFDEYAEWAAANLLYLKKTFGLEAPYWSLFNEPDVVGWKSAELWLPWIKAVGARFRREGLKTQIMFPDFMNVHDAVKVCEVVLKDDEARQYIGALAYHHYRSSGDGPQPFLKAVASAETADAGKMFERLTVGARQMAELGRTYHLPSWETETAYYPKNVVGLTEWEIGRGRANEIYYELLSGASAVQGMLMVWVDAVDPRYNTTMQFEGHHIVMTTDGKNVSHWEVSKDCGAVFAHYARFVRPGDHRVGVRCGDPLLRVTAFAAKNNRYIAVAVNNAADSKPIAIHLNHAQWRISGWGGLLTDAGNTLSMHGIEAVARDSDRYTAVMPAFSLATFVWSEGPLERLMLPADVSVR